MTHQLLRRLDGRVGDAVMRSSGPPARTIASLSRSTMTPSISWHRVGVEDHGVAAAIMPMPLQMMVSVGFVVGVMAR